MEEMLRNALALAGIVLLPSCWERSADNSEPAGAIEAARQLSTEELIALHWAERDRAFRDEKYILAIAERGQEGIAAWIDSIPAHGIPIHDSRTEHALFSMIILARESADYDFCQDISARMRLATISRRYFRTPGEVRGYLTKYDDFCGHGARMDRQSGASRNERSPDGEE
jgi:hypothetical protein